jgi:predicted nucleic acid-binding protein
LIFLDTSVLVEAITGRLETARALHRVIEQGERLAVSTLVLFEWLRGPRSAEQIELQQALLPLDRAVPFGPREADFRDIPDLRLYTPR